jgi:restriction system protein
MERLWMVRGEGGSLYDDFRDRGVAAIGWRDIAEQAKPGVARKKLIELYQQANPDAKPGTARSGGSQVWRFVNEIQVGDGVVTYSPRIAPTSSAGLPAPPPITRSGPRRT